ncbi:hypothetical protein V1502_18470 [Bacillus sp. SCS-153A]|uniref:hypothetical protein n=1 Tax=Rossellomorea sedimentorum TaxID=3115294 RepID=UPI0039062BC3
MKTEELSRLIGEIYKKVIMHINKEEMRNEVNNHLLQVLKEASTEAGYRDELIKGIAFHVESTKALHVILYKFLENSNYPSISVIQKSMEAAKQAIQGELASLAPLYQEKIENENSVNDQVTQMEIYYTTSMTEIKLMFHFIEAFASEKNKKLFEPLFSASAEEVGETLLKYTRTYSSLLFERAVSSTK